MRPDATTGWLLIAAMAISSSAAAQEKTIPCSGLPAAIQQGLLAQNVGSQPKECTSEREDGQTYYEAEFLIGGHSKDLLFDSAGEVVEVEEQVALEALPQPVRDSLVRKASGGEIRKVESITKKGSLVAYEAEVTREGKRSEIQVGPAGDTLDHEE